MAYIIYSNNPDFAVRDDGACIAIGEQFAKRFENPDFQKYQAWLAEGNKPEYIERVKDAWILIREKRNSLLVACDWTQLPDVAIDKKTAKEWQVYRQALRDIADNFNTPDEVIFPIPPK